MQKSPFYSYISILSLKFSLFHVRISLSVHPVDKAEPPLPRKIELAVEQLARITILYNTETCENVGIGTNWTKTKRGIRLIEGVEIRPRHGSPFFAGGSTVIINARAQFTSGSRRPSRQLALLNDTERRARFKSLSPRRCSLNGTCHHVKIQFVPRQVGNENWGEGRGERRQRSRGTGRDIRLSVTN